MNKWDFLGIKVIESPHLPATRPRYQLPQADKFPLPPGFREEFDAWVLSFFGTEQVMYVLDTDMLGMNDGKLIVANPTNLAILKGTP